MENKKAKGKRESAKTPSKAAEKTGKSRNLVSARGRIFQGEVTRKHPGRITIELERSVYIQKYERFMKKKTKIHARLPESINAEIGDVVKVQECRPLSKIIHFIVIEKVKSSNEGESK